MAMTEDELELLDPTLGPPTGKGLLSPRLDTLTGKTIGIIWNSRPPGDLMLDRMIEILRERHDIRQVVFRAKAYIGNIAPKEIFDELSATCDGAITGIGD